jgi:uncharacterized integral membrane protein
MTELTRARIKRFATLALLGLVVLIALQNIQEATVSVLFWTMRLPVIVVIVLSYAVGLIVGWLYWPFRSKRSD